MTPLRTVERDWYADRRALREVKPRHLESPRPAILRQPDTQPNVARRAPAPYQLAEKQAAMRRALQNARPKLREYKPLSRIIDRVAAALDMEPTDIRGRDQGRVFAFARHIAMYLARRNTLASLPLIGRAFGMHHTTVLYAVRSIERRRKVDTGLDRLLLNLETCGQARKETSG